VVVDDSPMMLKTLSLLLEREKGLQLVGTATDGRHAVRRAIELEPDLVLMDLRLPGMNGFEATRRIKARSPAPAVIMVTADDTPECRAAASAAGTDGFVGKQQMFTQLAPAIRKLFPKAASAGLVLCCVLAAARAAWAEQTPAPADTAPVQAIQQATDPSAAVTAYANGIALDRNDPKLYEAYVARMVDFGLPELAYHQARMLTTLQSSNGLAWGVVAYVDARRGQMADAILAVNLAGQFAPENKFVAHTAGELLAWYDLKADKTLPENARQGLAKIRALLGKQAAFTGAYDTACKAYQAQANAEVQPAQAAPGQYAPAPQASGAPPLPATPAAPPPPQVPLEGDLVAPRATRPLPPRPLTIRTIPMHPTAGRPISVTTGAQAGSRPPHGLGGSPVASGVGAAFSRSGRSACLAILIMAAASGMATIGAAMGPLVLDAIPESGTTVCTVGTAFLGHQPGRAVRWPNGLTRVRGALRL